MHLSLKPNCQTSRVPRLLLVAISLIVCSIQSGFAHAADFPDEAWRQASASQMQNWSSAKLAEAQTYWKKQGSTGYMVVEHGRVVVAWGDCDRPVNCHSVRKSFLSVLYGIYQPRVDIDLSKTLKDLGIDDKPPSLTKVEKQATLGDLLKARSGVYHPAAYETQGMKAAKPKRGSHAPGAFWYYNNWDFNALGTIFQQLSGKTVFEAFEEEIANKIGMQDFDWEKHTRFVYESSSEHPAYAFKLSTRDRARFGHLCLMNGKWNHNQIVPKGWLEESTKAYSKSEKRNTGYGYMWWTGNEGQMYGCQFQGHVYAANGYLGQRIMVIPELDMVVVQTVDRSAGDSMTKGTSFDELLKRTLAARREAGN